MRRLKFIFLLSVLLTLTTITAQAQTGNTNQQVTQSVMAGGGGTSSSGSFQVEGTVGQSATDTSAAGTYSLSSGFWPGAAALTPTTLSVSDVTATYGGTATLTATLTANGATLSNRIITFTLNGTSVGTATTDSQGIATLNNVTVSGINAGTYTGAVTAQFADDLSFAHSNASGQLTIAKATPLLQVAGGTFTYDGQPHTAIVSVTGINNEALSPLTVLYNGASSPPVNAGTYPITGSYAGDQNYNAVTNNQQSIVITQATQALSFGALANKTFGDANFTVSAAASSGLSVSFNASGNCTVSGSTVHLTGAGSCTVTASQPGDGNYKAATPVAQTFAINQATAGITLNNLSQTYDGTPKAATATTVPSGLNVTITYSQNGTVVASPTNAGSYNVSAAITDANYQGSTTGVLVINKATPVLTWDNPANITYGTPLSAMHLNATASVAGTFTYNPPAGTILNVGPHQLTVTFTPSDTANYTTVQANVSITVDQVTAAAFNFDNPTYSVNEGDGHVTITVNRTGNGTGAASVDYKTSDTAALQDCNVTNGIASSRCDYATTVGTLRFNAGEMSKTIFIPLVDDSYAEGPETFSITLSNAQGESLGAVSTATITITDNETLAGSNPISTTDFFIRQQYIDFLGRDPDPPGFTGWQNILNNCAAGDTSCDRINVSSGFFRSPEFQSRGYFIFRFYSASLGRNPSYAEFMPDLGRVSGFLTDAQLEANKVAFISEFMTRTEFVNRYGSLSNSAFVDTLIQASGLQSHPLRGPWIDVLNNGTATRAQVLRAFVESKEVYDRFYNQAFVVMQYFGYLRRDPDAMYMQWIQTLNQTGDYRMLISGFLNSNEYVKRFGP